MLDPYGDAAGGTAVALVNTLDLASGVDAMVDASSCAQLLSDGGWVLDAVSAPELRALRDLRPRLRMIFDATDERKAVLQLNRLLSENHALPQLTDHDGNWHFHYTQPGASLAVRVATTCAMALLTIMRTDGLTRFRICAAEECTNVLLDTSKNRSRRFCDAGTCRNRANVAAYRARLRARGQTA
jgi:predicted RNA-binding Zn ribbon-like protein